MLLAAGILIIAACIVLAILFRDYWDKIIVVIGGVLLIAASLSYAPVDKYIPASQLTGYDIGDTAFVRGNITRIWLDDGAGRAMLDDSIVIQFAISKYASIMNSLGKEYKGRLEKTCCAWKINSLDVRLGPPASAPTFPTPRGATVDWRDKTFNGSSGDWTTVAKDQGSCGSCWAFAANGLLEARLDMAYNNTGKNMDLSEQYIISCNNNSAGDCSGGYPVRALNYTLWNGTLSESCYAYVEANASDPDVSNATCNTTYHFIEEVFEDSNGGWSDLKAAVDNGPVAVCFDVMNDFYYSVTQDSFDSNGVYVYNATAADDGNHCVTIVGYNDTDGETYDGYWIIKNSWGASWGPWGDGFCGFAWNQTLNDNAMENYFTYANVSRATIFQKANFGATTEVPSSDWSNSAPQLEIWQYPDSETGVPTTPTLKINVSDADISNQTINVTWQYYHIDTKDVRRIKLGPDDDYGSQDWTSSTGGANWNCVDDFTNGDFDYVYYDNYDSIDEDEYYTEHITDPTTNKHLINVSVYAYAKSSINDDAELKLGITTVSGFTSADEGFVGSSYDNYSHIWDTKPSGGAWSWSDFDEDDEPIVGIQGYSSGSSGQLRVSSVEIRVYYNFTGWTTLQYNETSSNGTLTCPFINATENSTTYMWRVLIRDNHTTPAWTNSTQNFTTTSGLGWDNSNPVTEIWQYQDAATDVPLTPTLKINVSDPDISNQTINVTWLYNDGGNWYTFGYNETSTNTTGLQQVLSNASSYETGYQWRVVVRDNATTPGWDNSTQAFQTIEAPAQTTYIKAYFGMTTNLITEAWGNWSQWWKIYQLPQAYTTTVLTNGTDYFVWLGDNGTAYDVIEAINVTWGGSEYVAIWTNDTWSSVNALWNITYGNDPDSNNWTVHTFDVIQTYITDDTGTEMVSMLPNDNINYGASRAISCTNTSDNKGYNFVAYGPGTSDLETISETNLGQSTGYWTAYWNDAWHFWIANISPSGFNTNVPEWGVLQVKVGQTRTLNC